MKKLRTAYLLSMFLLGTLNSVYSNQLVFDSITQAIKAGDANELASFFDETIDITILEDEYTHSQTQAKQVVQNFFEQYPVQKFSIIHNGTSNHNAKYGIGKLETTKGNYRVYFFLEEKGGTKKIQELRFEQE